MGLDTVELILEAEKRFDVAIPNDQAEKTATVTQLARLLCDLRAQTAKPLPYDAVLIQLRELIAEMFGIPIERIVPEARFVKDLGLD